MSSSVVLEVQKRISPGSGSRPRRMYTESTTSITVLVDSAQVTHNGSPRSSSALARVMTPTRSARFLAEALGGVNRRVTTAAPPPTDALALPRLPSLDSRADERRTGATLYLEACAEGCAGSSRLRNLGSALTNMPARSSPRASISVMASPAAIILSRALSPPPAAVAAVAASSRASPTCAHRIMAASATSNSSADVTRCSIEWNSSATRYISPGSLCCSTTRAGDGSSDGAAARGLPPGSTPPVSRNPVMAASLEP